MSRCALQWLIATLFVLVANPVLAAADAFLCITDAGYPGEATVAGFSGCSELVDFGAAAFLDGSTPIARDIKLDKVYDTMSGPLRTAMVNLTTLNEVKIRLVNITTMSNEFFDIRLLGARVNSQTLSWSSGANGPVSETIGFSAANIEIKYRPANGAGMLGTPIFTCWNVAAASATNLACP